MSSDYVNMLGYTAGLAMASTYTMKTMIPLRVAGIVSNLLFIAYGYFANVNSVLIMHTVLLPLNGYRLHEMIDLVRRVSAAAGGDQSMDWIKRHMRKRKCKDGEVVFRAGDEAKGLFYTVSGSFRLPEIGVTIKPGTLIGEMGLVSPGNVRTLSFVCEDKGELLYITYSEFRQLYFQNPQFGFAFLRIISERLFAEIERLKKQGAQQGASSVLDKPEGQAQAQAGPAQAEAA